MFECYADLEEILEARLSEQTDVIENTEEQDKVDVACGDNKSILKKGALPVFDASKN